MFTTDKKQGYVIMSFPKPSKRYDGNTSPSNSDLTSLHPTLLNCYEYEYEYEIFIAQISQRYREVHR